MSNRNNINTNPNNSEAFIDLVDTPKDYTGSALLYCQVKNDQSGIQFASASGTGVTDFIELNDCPSSYTGSNNYQVVVNAGATGLTFVPNGSGVTEFIQCSDTPMTYAGTNSFDIVNVTTGHNALQFTSLPLLAGFTTPITALMDTPSTYGAPGQYLGVNSTSTGTAWQTIPEIITENQLNIFDTTTATVPVNANSTYPYIINTTYVTLNDGFTLSVPNRFSPSLTETYTLNWAFSFQNNKATSVSSSSFQQVSIYLYNSSGGIVATILNKTYPTSTMAQSPSFDSHTESGTVSIPLVAGTIYYYRINMSTASDVGGTFITGNKTFDLGGRVPQRIVDSTDYNNAPNPLYGEANQVLTSNGVDTFNLTFPLIVNSGDYVVVDDLPYGEEGQVITSNGVDSFSLVTPLIINEGDYSNGDAPYGTAGQVITSTGSGFTLSTPISYSQTATIFVDMYEYLWLTYQNNPNGNLVCGGVPLWFTKINNIVTMTMNMANNFILSQILDPNSSIILTVGGPGGYAVVPNGYRPNQLQYPVQNFQATNCSYLAANQTAPSPPNTPFRPMMCYVWYNTGQINLLNLYNNSSNGSFGNIYFYPMGFSMSWKV